MSFIHKWRPRKMQVISFMLGSRNHQTPLSFLIRFTLLCMTQAVRCCSPHSSGQQIGFSKQIDWDLRITTFFTLTT